MQNVKPTYKRDRLIEIEQKIQNKWAVNKTYEVDAPTDTTVPKFMATFPFPYMNGRLHLGHSFSLSKAEFAVGFEQLRGKKTLFPFGFHCTGMPIKACADKLAYELSTTNHPIIAVSTNDSNPNTLTNIKHTKVLAKTGGESSQFKIMESLGVPIEEIPKFVDPQYWIEYFPPKTIEDLKRFGIKVDWRRSFITTDKNPYFDSFVRWQFNLLKKDNLLRFGKRYTIISPRDGQPCQDHDRASGEGVNPQEFTGLLFKVISDSSPASKSMLSLIPNLTKSDVYLIGATLRPETIYGLTNVWASPSINYIAFFHCDGWIGICTEHALRNGFYQGWVQGEWEILAVIPGTALLGVKVESPLISQNLQLYHYVYVLPMLNLLPDKGTGLVASVPSDSPDDYATMMDLMNKPALRAKFSIEDEMVLPFPPIEIIQTQGYTTPLMAAELCTLFNIKSQNDREGLLKAKAAAYKDGFYSGTILVGPYAGSPVSEVKSKIKMDLIDTLRRAIPYAEPESKVVARTGDECVVGLMDQWYIAYGEPEWKAQVIQLLKRMNLYQEEVRHQMDFIINWLGQWACARSFGLGSKLPWDQSFLIESLSDSTIYMAYYTVSHFLQNGTLDGSGTALRQIEPSEMTDQVWSFLFQDTDIEKLDTTIPKALLIQMKNEFSYWYPMDLRTSGKDLLFNHLIFMLYVHCAIFKEHLWPRSIRVTGHLLLNAAKMSKSTGNFMTLSEAISTFSADATRFALADAGDTLDDANFSVDTANAAILKLFTLLEWVESIPTLLLDDKSRELNHFDLVFLAQIDLCIRKAYDSYEKMLYREALKWSFHEILIARDRYREVCLNSGLRMSVVTIDCFIRTFALINFPIISHFCEHLLDHLEVPLKERHWPNSVSNLSVKDGEVLMQMDSYCAEVEHRLRIALGARKKEEDSIALIVAVALPRWQLIIIDILKGIFDGASWLLEDAEVINKVLKSLKDQLPPLPREVDRKVIPWMIELKKRVESSGLDALNNGLLIPFDEMKTLQLYLPHLRKNISVSNLPIFTVEMLESIEITKRSALHEFLAQKAIMAIPGEPAIISFISKRYAEGADQLVDKLGAFTLV